MNYNGHPKAIARLRGGTAHPGLRGTVTFYQRQGGVIVEAEICGLPRSKTGFFAFHIHEGGSCAGEGFPETVGHFNPGKTEHPNHAGDLPPLLADHGMAYLRVFTHRFCLEEIIGKTVVIHSRPDDFHSQPSGNAGEKIGCGLIVRCGTS